MLIIYLCIVLLYLIVRFILDLWIFLQCCNRLKLKYRIHILSRCIDCDCSIPIFYENKRIFYLFIYIFIKLRLPNPKTITNEKRKVMGRRNASCAQSTHVAARGHCWHVLWSCSPFSLSTCTSSTSLMWMLHRDSGLISLMICSPTGALRKFYLFDFELNETSE